MSDNKNFSDFITREIFKAAFYDLKRSQKKCRFEHEYHQGYITLRAFEENIDEHFSFVNKSLSDQTYRFSKLHPVLLPKEGKAGYRMICIPTVQDRIVQQLLITYLSEELDIFRASDFAVSGKGTRYARKMATQLRASHPYALKTDISAFFDNVNRVQLLKKIRSEITSVDVFYLLESAIRCDTRPIRYQDNAEKTQFIRGKLGKGVRQGMPISPLLASFYLSNFDEHMKQQGFHVVRYADDLLFLTGSKQESLDIFEYAKVKLQEEGLTLPPLGNGEKSQIYEPHETIRFLGMDMMHDAGQQKFSWHIPQETIDKVKQEFESFAHISQNIERGLDFAAILRKMNHMMSGYLSCFNDADQGQLNKFSTEMNDKKERVIGTLLKELGVNLDKLSCAQKKFLLGLSKEEVTEAQKKQRQKPKAALFAKTSQKHSLQNTGTKKP